MPVAATQTPVPCRVCHRPLRSLASIAIGLGPVCAKRVRRELEQILERARSGVIEPDYQIAYAMSPEERQLAVEARVGRRTWSSSASAGVRAGSRWWSKSRAQAAGSSGNP
jgi:hypothetical protein